MHCLLLSYFSSMTFVSKEYRKQKKEKALQRMKTEMQKSAQKPEGPSSLAPVDLHDLLTTMSGALSQLSFVTYSLL